MFKFAFQNESNSCARHESRVDIMKKILTFAIMALLFGGLAFNANAQKPIKAKKSAKTVEAVKGAKADAKTNERGAKAKPVDYDKLIKDYEQAVEKCVSLYNAIQVTDNGKQGAKDFEQSLSKAENLKSQLEAAKPQLNRTQVDRFNKANQKLLQVYKKG